MRVLLDSSPGDRSPGPLDEAALRALYAWPDAGGVRANLVSTLDGAATGADGRSGSINTAADGRVFHLQRELADVVLVGAGTARAEGYRPGPTPIAVVTRSGELPPTLATGGGRVVVVTCAASGRTPSHDVWVHGEDTVDLTEVIARLHRSGMPCVLAEGGPHLFGDLLAAGLVDELALTLAPRIVGGDGPRVTATGPLGAAAGLDASPVHVLEEDGTLLGLWRVSS